MPWCHTTGTCVKEVIIQATCTKDVKVTSTCKVPCKPTPTPCVIPVKVVTKVDCSTPGTRVTCPAGVPAGSTCFTVGVKKTCDKTVTVNKKYCKKSVDCSTTTKTPFSWNAKELVVVPCPAGAYATAGAVSKTEKTVKKTCFKTTTVKKTCTKIVAC